MQWAAFDAERFGAIEATAGLFTNSVFIEQIGDFTVVADSRGGRAFGRVHPRDFHPVIFGVGAQFGRYSGHNSSRYTFVIGANAEFC